MVDDDASTLDGLSYILTQYPDEFRVAAAVSSAIQLLEILDKDSGQADVVVTDIRMPIMDGVELVKILTAQYPHIKTIVLSGHSDFEYVRTCLKNGASDYLLKPCRYQTLLALLRRITAERESGENILRIDTAKNDLRDAILNGGEFKGEDLLPSRWLSCLRLAQDCVKPDESVNGCVKNILGENEYDIVEMNSDIFLFIGADWDEAEAKKHWSDIYRTLSAGKLLSAMACAKIQERDILVRTAQMCRDLASFAEFNGISRPVFLDEQTDLAAGTEDAPMLEYLSRERFSSLFYLKRNQSQDALIKRYISEFPKRERYWNPTRMKNATARLIFGVERPGANGSGRELSSNDATQYLERIKTARKPDDLVEIIRDFFCADSAAGMSVRQPRYITEAVSYINAHYMKNLLLNEIANKVFLNEWYFSSQFKKHMKMSFREYLNQVRLEAAKRLLLDCDLKVSQVAELVGFGESTYFATCFKNYTGITPMEFKKQS